MMPLPDFLLLATAVRQPPADDGSDQFQRTAWMKIYDAEFEERLAALKTELKAANYTEIVLGTAEDSRIPSYMPRRHNQLFALPRVRMKGQPALWTLVPELFGPIVGTGRANMDIVELPVHVPGHLEGGHVL